MNIARRRTAALADPDGATKYLYRWLLLVIFLEYARPTAFIPGVGVLPFSSFIPLLLFGICLFAKGLRPTEEIFQDPMPRWLLFYFGLIVFSLVHASVTMYAWGVVTATMGYLFLWFIIVRVATSMQRIRGIFATLILAHLFLLAMNPQAILNPSERHYIVGGTFLGDGNDFSLSVCICLPMAIEMAIASKSKLKQILWWGSLLVLILAIIGSSSRGGTLGLGALGIYLWLRSPKKGLTLAGFLVAVMILLAYAPDTYFKRMNTISTYQDDGSAMGRITAWKSGVRMWADNPLLGVGAGNFPNSYGTKYKPPGVDAVRWKTAHSSYFLVLGELSTPGIITLFVLIFGSMRANTRVGREAGESAQPAAQPRKPGRMRTAIQNRFLGESDRMLYLLNASMLGFAIPGAFLSAAYYPHIFVVGGLMLAARRLALQKKAAALQPVEAGAEVGSALPSGVMRRGQRAGN